MAGKKKTRSPMDPVRRQRLVAAVQGAITLGVIVGAGFGWSAMSSSLRAYAASLPHAGKTPGSSATATPRSHEPMVVLEDAPAWVSPLLRQELASLAASKLSSDPFDHHSLRAAASALAGASWLTRVDRVQRMRDGSVHVWATYRQPAAVVEGKDGYHLVDPAAVRLPGLYVRHQVEALGLPIVVGVRNAPRNEGQAWPGEDLRAGLDLAALLAGEAYAAQIRAIDVSRQDGRGEPRLTVLTEQGRVLWGEPVHCATPIEPDVATKLDRLRSVYQQRGSIDAGGKQVDLTGTVVFVQTPE